MIYKKFLLLFAGIISGLIFGFFIFKNYLYFHCDVNFEKIYIINVMRASELIDKGNYDDAIGMLNGLTDTYYEQKQCIGFDVTNILIGASIQISTGGQKMVSDLDRLKKIEYLKRQAIKKKVASSQKANEIKKIGS